MPQYTDGIRLEIFEWQRVEAPPATDISLAADMTPWIVSSSPAPGGFAVFRRSSGSWSEVGVGAVQVEIAPAGDAWLITDGGELLHRDPGEAEWYSAPCPGRVIDCSAGLDGVLWAVVAPDDGPARLLRRQGEGWSDQCIPNPVLYPNAVPWTAADDDGYGGTHESAGPIDPRSVAVMADGMPWVVDADGTHYRRLAGGWQVMPHEPAQDVDISLGGNVWIVGSDPRAGGFGPWRYYHGTDWDAHDGAAVRIAVGRDGLPWIVDSSGGLFRHHVKL